ncbi:hypothetical protein OPV22_034384 [Ensete ventricosum]|uniref:Uncharacterized protein n=1 Tax=Ensete ventricosum TaxID=4639 RepID=A0AAV8PX53_ENSVE|nr:hypothetical protein OPV22_034384 [Ensete ventricosum]
MLRKRSEQRLGNHGMLPSQVPLADANAAKTRPRSTSDSFGEWLRLDIHRLARSHSMGSTSTSPDLLYALSSSLSCRNAAKTCSPCSRYGVMEAACGETSGDKQIDTKQFK